jgi:6-pyruvoyltetrahydropterin/6-carboxytetrahydropterin synthase
MPFEVSTRREFSAAHQIRLHDGSLEPLHGHNWRVTVMVSSDKLDRIGFVMDFHELERQIDEIVRPFHNRNLNELAQLSGINPTAENVALHIGLALRIPAPARLVSVEITEAPGCTAVYRA